MGRSGEEEGWRGGEVKRKRGGEGRVVVEVQIMVALGSESEVTRLQCVHVVLSMHMNYCSLCTL